MTAVDVLWSRPTVERADPSWLDGGETDRLRELGRGESRREFLTSRVLVKLLVAELAGVEPADVRLGYTCAACGDAHGRPVVTSPSAASGIEVSLAHSGDRVVVAAARGAAVGVDVEPTAATSFTGFDAVALTAGERRGLPQLDAAARAAAGAALWVRKEALLKAGGTGLTVDPSTVAAVDLACARAQVRDLDLGRLYAAAVAVLTTAPIDVRVREVSAARAAGAGPARAARTAGAR